MPWREPQIVPLSRIAIVSHVPSESGVYGIYDGESCLFIGEAWNLRARLMELVNVLQDLSELSVTYELCSDAGRLDRKEELASRLLTITPSTSLPRELPGIRFRDSQSDKAALRDK